MHQIKNSLGKFASVGEIERYIVRIAQGHRVDKRAFVFALIVQDFDNPHIEKILSDMSYYNALDYISGKYITVFYIHSKYLGVQSERAKKSNKQRFEFTMQKIDTTPNLSPKFIAENIFNVDSLPSPSVLFFNINGDSITEYTIAHLQHNEIEKGFGELLNVIKTAAISLAEVKEENRNNDKEVFALVKRSIESAEFWKSADSVYGKMMKVKDFLFFWKV